MVKFEQIDPTKMNNLRQGRRGRVSYPILKGFLETGFFLGKLDRTGVQQSMISLRAGLNSYITSHSMPIKIFQRQGELYMMRLDITEEGTPIENWQEVVNEDVDPDNPPTPLTPAVVTQQYTDQKGESK